jgi:hypothetical protein
MAFHEVGATEGKYDSQVVRSLDDGQTWSNVGVPLPSDVRPLTIDIGAKGIRSRKIRRA